MNGIGIEALKQYVIKEGRFYLFCFGHTSDANANDDKENSPSHTIRLKRRRWEYSGGFRIMFAKIITSNGRCKQWVELFNEIPFLRDLSSPPSKQNKLNQAKTKLQTPNSKHQTTSNDDPNHKPQTTKHRHHMTYPGLNHVGCALPKSVTTVTNGDFK